jgi:hypothetical protein
VRTWLRPLLCKSSLLSAVDSHALCHVVLCCAVQMSERDARTQLVELQERLDSRDAAVAKLKKQLQSRSDDLATQRAVNQQLMLKKEEVGCRMLVGAAGTTIVSCTRTFVGLSVPPPPPAARPHQDWVSTPGVPSSPEPVFLYHLPRFAHFRRWSGSCWQP